MTQRLLVLGAGMIGTCTALHLARRGHEVILIDRRAPGQETSYGNAGLIQREAVEPYPFPRDFGTLLRVACKQGADVHYHARALPGLALPLLRYWANSAPRRHARISAAYARLIAHCLTGHEELIAAAGATDLIERKGYLAVCREPRTFALQAERAQRLAARDGVRHTLLDPAALAAAEPALRRRLAGAIHWLDPWAVSHPGELVSRYAALFTRQGGRIVAGDANTLQATGTGWRVQTSAGWIDAPQAVVALGPWSGPLLRRLGLTLPLFVKRGYHRHYTGGAIPRRPLLDADRGLVIAPMRDGVRITTGAEFARLDAPPTPVQVTRAEVAARELIDLPHPVEEQPWLGARPCTPDMLPVIGPAPRLPGLWCNFGHAHQGFTLGPVCGQLLAEMIDGVPPLVDPAAYAPARFAR